MKLFKNVDIEDLDKILKEGILPISKTGNNNWGSNNRAKNSEDVVYLFNPVKKNTAMVTYGLALIEVETTNATQVEFSEFDSWGEHYSEYITDEIPVSEIKAVYLPNIFNYSERPVDLSNPLIKLVDVEFFAWSNEFKNMSPASTERKSALAKTNRISTYDFNYLRIKENDNSISDVSDVWEYLI